MLALLLASASAAQAKLGDTLQEMRQRWGLEDYESGNVRLFNSKGDGRNIHGWGILTVLVNNVSVYECYLSGTLPLDKGEPPAFVVRMMLDSTSPNDKWHAVTSPFGAQYAMQNKDDSMTALLRYNPAHKLGWAIEIGYTWAVAYFNKQSRTPFAMPDARPAPKPTPSVDEVFVPDVAPASPDSSRPPADCAIVAAQAYAKLKPVTYWCQIVGMKAFWQDDGKSSGHAMVLYKYQSDGNVFAYDERGTRTLGTASESLEAIQPALQSAMPDCGIEKLAFLTH
jgi:hypothetical protein